MATGQAKKVYVFKRKDMQQMYLTVLFLIHYRNLQGLGLKLPSESSLRSWLKGLSFRPGITEVQNALEEQIKTISDSNRDCILLWDEMSLKELIQYNKYTDEFEGIVDHGDSKRELDRASEVLVFMVVGLKKNWKYPVSFYFSKDNTTSDELRRLLDENLSFLKKCGLRVRVGICDMSFTNQGLYRALNVTKEQPYIERDGQKIYMIHDVPHLMKLIRNNLKKHRFRYGQKTANWKHIKKFWDLDKTRVPRMCPKLTKYHFDLTSFSKMKVKLATQVFSHSVYAGMLTMITLHLLPPEAKQTAIFVKKVNDMFDLLNVSRLEDRTLNKSGGRYFTNLSKLDEYYKLFASVQVPSRKKGNPPCISGLLLTLKGIKSLSEDLKNEGYKYILTRRLQQDPLEQYFSFIRMRGGWSRNPTSRQFRHNFRFNFVRALIHSTKNGNCSFHETQAVSKAEALSRLDGIFKIQRSSGSGIAQKCKSIAYPEPYDEIEEEISSSSKNSTNFYSFKDKPGRILHELDVNSATYMINAISKKFLKKSPCKECEKMYYILTDECCLTSSLIFIGSKAYDSRLLRECGFPSYAHVLIPEVSDILVNVCNNFTNHAVTTLKSSGTQISERIFNECIKDVNLTNWFNERSGNCRVHRENIVKLLIRSLIFLVVKDQNQIVKQTKSWSQTRIRLRNQ